MVRGRDLALREYTPSDLDSVSIAAIAQEVAALLQRRDQPDPLLTAGQVSRLTPVSALLECSPSAGGGSLPRPALAPAGAA
jgi:hypothetical protein